LSYRTKEAAKSAPFLTNKRNGTSDPFVLIHPVGIGMASWFYDRMLEAWPTAGRSRTDEQNQREAPPDPSSSSATLFAINLRGCGRRDARLLQSAVDSAAPISLERWVQDCAAFVDDVVLKDPSLPSPPFPFAFLPQKPSSKRCHLVVQGGLAPLGLELARRYPGRIRSLTLCSPPEVLQVAPQADVEKNLRLLASPLGNAAIERLLENPAAIRLFSNLFLFASPCDAEWVRQASSECGPEVRRAVQFFNAGGCSRVASADLPPLEPPVLILQGSQDLRRRSPDYVASKSRVEFRTLLGAKNVLPWEAPTETAAAIQDFVRQNS
jgi:pimeloyl-ACP methyl ester carboxylesterase